MPTRHAVLADPAVRAALSALLVTRRRPEATVEPDGPGASWPGWKRWPLLKEDTHEP
jgi:hypothetical protein